MSDETCPVCAKPVFEDVPAELAQARQQIEELKSKLEKSDGAWLQEIKRTNNAEQQLAAAQAALLFVKDRLGDMPAVIFAELDQATGYQLSKDILPKIEQPTDALRAFVLGLLPPDKEVTVTNLETKVAQWVAGWMDCKGEIRSNLERALEVK